MSCLEVRCEALPRRDSPLCPVCLREVGAKDRVSDHDELIHAACDYARVSRRSTPNPLVLIVDDNDDHRTMYAMYLQSAGFRVVEAADGTSAIGKARNIRPDVILLDLYMPGLNGWQACRWLKTSVETLRIPVIAITGHAVDSSRRQAVEAGCDRFITKGVDPKHVIAAIRDVLSEA
jgi:two-component system, cell cycle response regulator DivK